MNGAEFKKTWFKIYEQLSAEAAAFRNSPSVSFGLLNAYDLLDDINKEYVHEVLADWLLSDDNKLRFDAEFLTSQRRIVQMRQAVERAIEKSEKLTGSEAFYEAEKLKRILTELK